MHLIAHDREIRRAHNPNNKQNLSLTSTKTWGIGFYSQLSLIDTYLRQATGVGPCTLFVSHFIVSKLAITL